MISSLVLKTLSTFNIDITGVFLVLPLIILMLLKSIKASLFVSGVLVSVEDVPVSSRFQVIRSDGNVQH